MSERRCSVLVERGKEWVPCGAVEGSRSCPHLCECGMPWAWITGSRERHLHADRHIDVQRKRQAALACRLAGWDDLADEALRRVTAIVEGRAA